MATIDGWVDFDDIYDPVLRHCGTRLARLVEIGAYKGRSKSYLAERIRETRATVQIDVVDTFAGDRRAGHQDLWPEFLRPISSAQGCCSVITVHRAVSDGAAV